MVLNVPYLKEVMDRRNWTISDLARRAGISTASVSRIMAGKRGAGTRAMAAIRKALPSEPIDKLFIL